MPFDDLKTLPEGFAVTPTMQPVAWAVTGSPQGLVHLCDSYELADRVAGTERLATAKDHRVRPLVYGDRPVAAAAATAADVARSVAETPEPQHADETRYGWRQKPDVGEGWRELGPDEILQQGDEAYVGHDQPQWVPTFCVGQRVADVGNGYRRRVTPSKPVEIDGNKPDVEDKWRWLEVGEVMASGDEVAMCNVNGQVMQWVTVYEDSLARGNTVTPHLYRFCRRRVTPVAEAPQSRPAETRASSRQHVIDYDRETREWNERADAELARRAVIPSEVARLKAENATLRSGVKLLSAEATTLRSEVERLTKSEAALLQELKIESDQVSSDQDKIKRLGAEVERLRLRPEEVRFLRGVKNFDGHLVNDLLKRQGGGE